MCSPKFSIITIAFNSEKTIERTIKSVLSQTYIDYEYIIVDGGSKDSTHDVIKKYEPLFEGRMKWKSEPDKGIYNAINKGLLRSNGEIIGIVNSDDWLEPDSLKKIVEAASSINDIDKSIICGSLRFHYNNGGSQIFKSDKAKFEKGIEKHSFGHGAYHPSMFVGRDVYKEIGFFDENYKIAGDIDFVYRCYKSGVKFYFIDSVLNNMSDGGASNALNLKKVVADKKYDFKKRNISTIRSIWILITFCLKLIIKKYIPKKIMIGYRDK